MLQARPTSLLRCPQEAPLDFWKNQSSYLFPTREFAAVQTVHEEMNIVWFQQEFYFQGPVESQLCSPVLALVRSAPPPAGMEAIPLQGGLNPVPSCFKVLSAPPRLSPALWDLCHLSHSVPRIIWTLILMRFPERWVLLVSTIPWHTCLISWKAVYLPTI